MITRNIALLQEPPRFSLRAGRAEAKREAHGSAGAPRRGALLGNNANNSSAIKKALKNSLKTTKYDIRGWAKKGAYFGKAENMPVHRVAYCGWATTSSDGGVGVRVSNGIAGFSGLQSCGSVWVCPVCASKIAARRSEELGHVLGWARAQKHTLAMVTLTVSHGKKDSLKTVWDAVSSGWEAVTSGAAWNDAETDEEFKSRLDGWFSAGFAHDSAKKRGEIPPRAPRGWHKKIIPTIRQGDKKIFGVLGWARAVEVTRGKNGWHVHIHAVMVLDGAENSHERAYKLADRMAERWNKGIGKKGFTSSKEHGVRVDVSVGAEKTLADYLAKSGEIDYIVRASVEKAGRDLAKEATLGQQKTAKNGGRTPFQILNSLRDGIAEDWSLWVEWEKGSFGRRQLTWSADLRQMAGLAVEQSDSEIAEEEIGTAEDTVLVLPLESWKKVRDSPEDMVLILDLAENSVDELKNWLKLKQLPWYNSNSI